MSEYDIKRGHFEKVEDDKLEIIMKDIFEKVKKKDDKLSSSFGALESITVWLQGKKTLCVETKMNTDVDDKTIKGAQSLGVTLQEYTDKYTNVFFEDLDTLRISRADFYPRATEHINEMIEIIKGLLEKGYAYEKDGSYYFSIEKFPNYGKLSKIDLAELKPGQRDDSDEYEKENARDFALWKSKKL